MAIEVISSTSIDDELRDTLQKLEVPAEFAEYHTTDDADVVVRLEEWRRKAYGVLDDLRTRLAARKEALSTELCAEVVGAAAQFDGDDAWVLDTTKEVAREILDPYETTEPTLLERILSHQLKPVFQKNPHPAVNTVTGRRLARPAGGTDAVLDYYEGQEWKRHPGMLNVLSWCVRHTENTVYERLWHLIIPPVMTLLDDYEVRYKLPGVRIISEMLDRVPPELLRRTGMDGLIFSSLNKCFTSLRDPGTPALLRLAVPTSVKLTELTTAPGSAQRFDQLCAAMGDGIVGSVWFYSTSEPDALQASLDTLPIILKALGVGAARYLKAMIPQLTYPLVSAADNATSLALQLSSARALRSVIAECAPRMQRWKGDIVNGVCRCWVARVESGARDNRRELEATLQDVCRDLAKACPSVVQDEYARLVRAEPNTFSALVGSD